MTSCKKATSSRLMWRAAVLPWTRPVAVLSAAYNGEPSMSVVLKAVGLGRSRRERQDGIETVQDLNGGLLIDIEDGRVLGRLQIEVENVRRFGF
jgi:hypothetical protein